MTSYDFGPIQELRRDLEIWYGRTLWGKFHSSLDREALAAEIATLIHDQVTPQQFFDAWDMIFAPGKQDSYPRYPSRFLGVWCKDDPSFRRACRELWHYKQEAIETEIENEWLDPMSIVMIGILTLSLCFGASLVIAQVIGLHLDSVTTAYLLVIYLLILGLNVGSEAMINVSVFRAQRFIRRIRVMRRHRAMRNNG